MSVVRFGNTTSGSNDIVEEISRKVPKGEQIRILQDTFPAGRVHGKTFYIGSLLGDPGQSLKLTLILPRSTLCRGRISMVVSVSEASSRY